MFFLNLALGQLLIAGGAVSLAAVAIYLFDRSRRKQAVSTLRFWAEAAQPVRTRRRSRIRQPWSLLLQLLAMLLLLLAVAQPRIGDPGAQSRRHVLILDTSSGMRARRGSGTVMETARLRAAEWLRRIPAADRVMLIRADALAAPATSFETDHEKIYAAIAASTAGDTALDLDRALATAGRARDLEGAPGEIVFVGTGRIRSSREQPAVTPTAFRVLSVADGIAHTGIARVSVRQTMESSNTREVVVSLRNYGTAPQSAAVLVGFNQAPAGAQSFRLAPGSDREVSFPLRGSEGGVLQVRIVPEAGFEDDRVELQLPRLTHLNLAVYTDRPAILKPLFAGSDQIQAQFHRPSEYPIGTDAVSVFDRFVPAGTPQTDAIYLDPPAARSPARVLAVLRNPPQVRWTTDSVLGQGLSARDLELDLTSVFRAEPTDIRVAEIAQGPILIARPGRFKSAFVGFDPESSTARFELSTPLIFANILRWIEPALFESSDRTVQSVGTVVVPLPAGAETPTVRTAEGAPIPFSIGEHSLRFFTGTRSNIRVSGAGRTVEYDLSLPEFGTAIWTPPSGTRSGLPRRMATPLSGVELWPWLAALAMILLAVDWVLFGRGRTANVREMSPRQPLRRAS